MEAKEKFCVLIIEEKADLRTFYMSALTKTESYTVKNTATPQEALELLEKEFASIQMILFDWHMPEIDGYVFCQKIRSDARFDHIEILVCSSQISSEDSFLMTEMDVHYTMPKITNAGEFVTKVNDVKSDYTKVQTVANKLKKFQHLLNSDQLFECEELFKIPELETEINTNPRYVHLGGEMKILKKEYEKAVEFLKNYLTQNSSSAGAENLKTLSTLGKALCFLNRYDEALLIYERIESKSPKNLSHKVMIGDALLGLDKVPEAQEKYSQVLEKDPKNKAALTGMGKASAAKGDFEKSKSFFEQISGTFESRSLASFFNNRGVALVRTGNIDEAVLFYENALQFLDKYKSHVYFNLGMAYYRSGNIASAVSCFEAALNGKDNEQLKDKKILKELQEKGSEAFIAEFIARQGKK